MARDQRGSSGQLHLQLCQNLTLALWPYMERNKFKSRPFPSKFEDVPEPLSPGDIKSQHVPCFAKRNIIYNLDCLFMGTIIARNNLNTQ